MKRITGRMKIGMQERYRVVVPDRYLKTRFVDETVTIGHGEHRITTTDMGLQLLEGDREPVTYVPFSAIDGARLEASETRYQCRWKGEARYYDVHLPDGSVVADGAWAYPQAPDELALLRTHVAFDPGQFSEAIDSTMSAV